jgi:SAM-dependent methyltransferase
MDNLTATLDVVMAQYQPEPGSFRDRINKVFYRNGDVFRALSARGLEEWHTLVSTAFFQRYLADGKLVYTELESTQLPDGALADSWVGFLKHHTIPFISYPYEWSFGMLQDAALLQLDLLLAALDEGMTLKDATPFNCQWVGTKPVFIDLLSFEALTLGEPWVGYRQFCELFLYPLLLQAYKDVSFHPWLRGSLDGIEATDCQRLMSLRDLLRPGVLTHVLLHAKMQSRQASTTANMKRDIRNAGFTTALIRGNATRLRKLVTRLTWKRTTSTWIDYATANSYTEQDRKAKEAFVRCVVMSRSWPLVRDLGCNTGTFSRIAAENAQYVVAMDADHLTVERLYQELKAEDNSRILPLVMNVANASPNLGWRGLERKALPERGTPALTLCLALIHHLVISANIPLREFIDWLASLGTDVVIEFVAKNDPMVQQLLRNKKDQYPDYDQYYFEQYLSEAFDTVQCETLNTGTRMLYYSKIKGR